MSNEPQSFQRRSTAYHQQRLSVQFKRNAWTGPPSDTIYAGISCLTSDNSTSTVAIAIRDTTYLLDFMAERFSPEDSSSSSSKIVDFVLCKLREFGERHMEKFLGLAMPEHVAAKYPSLCSRLWAELDILPLVLPEANLDSTSEFNTPNPNSPGWWTRALDEQAESMGRKCVRLFGPEQLPLLQVGYQGMVEVDSSFMVHLASLDEYAKTVGSKTWASILHYAADVRQRKVKVAFFSATPQGGGVALMRHALVRLGHTLGVDFKWYVPKPRPGVFHVTKTGHNILQGVANSDQRITKEDIGLVMEWIRENSRRYWLCPGGPLRPPSDGGADFVVVDDPQMPALIPIAKNQAPNRPVIYRSHIQIRRDLISKPGSPQAELWDSLWENIRHADLFISHPVKCFVPANIPEEIVGYMPATTDWLDGLNKNMRDWDVAFYGRGFNAAARNLGLPTVDYPEDKYIVQIARFDPSKGIPDVIDAYEKFHNRLVSQLPDIRPPKLVLCGHGSVGDPDGAIVYDNAISHVERDLAYIRDMICVKRVRPSDQKLNAIISKAKVVLQLSTREGFEIKVSEAIHKGKPVIVSKAGGIPFQVEHGKNGFLVDVGDTDTVADHLFDLWTDQELYDRMSKYGRAHIPDEVSTCGNILNWLYLTSKLTKGEEVKPNGRWINDMAREEAGHPYTSDEARLKRDVQTGTNC